MIILFTYLPCFEEEEIRKCSCNCDRVIFVRKDIFELEELSKKFEEIGILDEVGKQMSQSDGSSTHRQIHHKFTYSQNLHKHTFLDHRYTVAQTEINKN